MQDYARAKPKPNLALRNHQWLGKKRREREKEKKRDKKGNEVNDAMQIDRWVCVSIDP